MLRNLSHLHTKKIKSFLNSINYVICDFDGVINDISTQTTIPDVKTSLKLLKKLNKKIYLITNNTTLSSKLFKLETNLNIDDAVNPTDVMIHYLKMKNFDKEIYLIGSNVMKNDFKIAGLKLITEGPILVNENLTDYIDNIKDNPNVGCVIIDWDFNITHLKLLRASIYLMRPDVEYLTGSVVEKITKGSKSTFGAGFFQKALSDYSQRDPISFAKPSTYLKDYIYEKFSITSPKNVLFIGDTIYEDMSFASDCGFQKLLVLSGLTTENDLKTLSDEKLMPDYYLHSLGELKQLLEKNFN